ncbi:ABC transporter related protein [Acidovorax delafieldii 2AN]|uniref:ABC transporter related protein n=1 Tax=Acidovorax delafieldii 2AN TaxID=573060 RepID=C5T0A7_ACIDE|nr:ABC transporter ATP-binding protein [Acidovorax delafieldii]EER62060.1 ABC transporter related protein [Acidovorax delafieldii 2AN]
MTTVHSPSLPNALEGRSLDAAYGRIRVVEGVDLQVAAGELVVLLGPNGAGKSSLLGAMAGTVRGGGALTLDGLSIAGLPPEVRAARGLAFVPERRGNVFPAMSVAENLELGLRLSPPARREPIRENILGMFPILAERMNAMAGMLSGGEQQMLAIGMALGREPRVLLLDEPSQGLAPVIFDLLRDAFTLLRRQGLALLVAEQNLPFAAGIADRYLVLVHGHLVAAGNSAELQGVDDLMALYMSADV